MKNSINRRKFITSISTIAAALPFAGVSAMKFPGNVNIISRQNKHSQNSIFPNFENMVMCGYQGWFRAEGDGSGEGWRHYGSSDKFDSDNITIDLWPDVSEYEKTYPTPFKFDDNRTARVFSSYDKSTVDLHYKWMRDYGIDGAFMQRFFGVTRTPQTRERGNVILGHALEASAKYQRAIAVMYDLSGIRATGEDCSSVIEDWKQLVDTLNVTTRGDRQNYLYHNERPLVAIWGLGFPDRPYDIRDIGVDKLIDFLKNDSEYGGCSVMLGVPTYYRDLDIDCLPDPYLHDVIQTADIVLPWMVQRFTPLIHNEMERYSAHLKADMAWCKERNVDYAPIVYPGFSWYNLSKIEFGGVHPIDQIPRQKGRFFWDQISRCVEADAGRIYVAMFDEIDEGTAIFKCSNDVPIGTPFQLIDYEGMPSDLYLKLAGKAGEMLRKEIPVNRELYKEYHLKSSR